MYLIDHVDFEITPTHLRQDFATPVLTAVATIPTMQILKALQCFEQATNGDLEFVYTGVIFRKDGVTFRAKSRNRTINPQSCCDTELEDIERISPEAYCPILPMGCTIVPELSDCYIKRPNPVSFGVSLDLLANRVIQDIATCEVIRKHPHPNLATYHGCMVSDGRVIGLCFEKYPQSLMDKINPGYLNKSAFILSEDRTVVRKEAARYLCDIEEGVRQLHRLGIIHNDLNPANIMITADNTAVIIDFDSSSAPGIALDNTKRTYGWYDRDMRVSRESNDLDALAELRVWLAGSSPEEFRFNGK